MSDNEKKPLGVIVSIFDKAVNRQIPLKEAYELLFKATKDIQDYRESVIEVTSSIRDSNYSGKYFQAAKQIEIFSRIPEALNFERLKKIGIKKTRVNMFEAEIIFHSVATQFYLNNILNHDLDIKKSKLFLRDKAFLGSYYWILFREYFHDPRYRGLKQAKRIVIFLEFFNNNRNQILSTIRKRHGYDSKEEGRFFSIVSHLELYLSNYLSNVRKADRIQVVDIVNKAQHDFSQASGKEKLTDVFLICKIYALALARINVDDSYHSLLHLKKKNKNTENLSLMLRLLITELVFLLNYKERFTNNWNDISLSIIKDIINLARKTSNSLIVKTMLIPYFDDNPELISKVVSKDLQVSIECKRLVYDFRD